jgi:hypothetical protein
VADSNPAADGGGGYDSEAIKTRILQEIADLKETVQSFGVQAIKDGSWFNNILRSCLSSYERKVMEQGGAAYLRGKYPGLPTDAVAGKLCELADRGRIPPQFVSATFGESGKRRTLYVDVEGFASHLRNQ